MHVYKVKCSFIAKLCMIPSKKRCQMTKQKKRRNKIQFYSYTNMLVGLRDSKKLENVAEKEKIIQKHNLCL